MENNKREVVAAVAACLAGVATEEQRALVRQWRDRSERNRMLWERLDAKKALGGEPSYPDPAEVEKGWRELERRIDRLVVRRRAMYVTAACAAAVVGFVLLLQFRQAGPPADTLADAMQTEHRAGAQLILADGSVVPIDELGDMEIREETGATIYKDSSHIDYSRNTVPEAAAEMYNELRMPRGESYTMTLSDGTRVFLNSESRLRFPVKFSGSRREVEFDGEAYFSVAKDVEHPFVIKAGGVEVDVLGTEFNLRAYGDEARVVTTLVSGKVRMNGDGGVCDMEPGEQAVYSTGSGTFSKSKVDVDFYTAWRRSEIMFRDASLAEIMKNLSRWYSIEYEFMDEKAAGIKLGGSFKRTDTIEPILDMMGRTGLLNVIWANNKIYFSTESR